MMKQLSALMLIVLMFVSADVMGQVSSRPNVSLQVGGQLRLLRPVGLNYAIDGFNTANPGWSTKPAEIDWTQGLSFAAAIHRSRSEIRLQVQTYNAASFGLGNDSLGLAQRLDYQLRGATYQLGLASNLIEINDYLSFGIGGAFAINHLRINALLQPEASYSPTAAVPQVQQLYKPSINLIAPINIGVLPWVSLRIEPTYQVFFSPANYATFSQAINGNFLSANDPSLETDADHFGVTASLLFFLRRRF